MLFLVPHATSRPLIFSIYICILQINTTQMMGLPLPEATPWITLVLFLTQIIAYVYIVMTQQSLRPSSVHCVPRVSGESAVPAPFGNNIIIAVC